MDLVTYGMTMLGTPYVWGGNTPLVGLDCSGYVCELLRSKGYIKYNEDLSSQGLYNRFARDKEGGVSMAPSRNALLFYGKDEDSIVHVAVAIDDTTMLEAGGGNSSTITMKESIKRNAMVRVRPINYRSDYLTAVHL